MSPMSPMLAERPCEHVGDARGQRGHGDADGENGEPEEIARDDVHGAAHGERGLRAALVQIDRDLAARVAEADDEHALVAEAVTISVPRAVDDLAAVLAAARPCRFVRD